MAQAQHDDDVPLLEVRSKVLDHLAVLHQAFHVSGLFHVLNPDQINLNIGQRFWSQLIYHADLSSFANPPTSLVTDKEVAQMMAKREQLSADTASHASPKHSVDTSTPHVDSLQVSSQDTRHVLFLSEVTTIVEKVPFLDSYVLSADKLFAFYVKFPIYAVLWDEMVQIVHAPTETASILQQKTVVTQFFILFQAACEGAQRKEAFLLREQRIAQHVLALQLPYNVTEARELLKFASIIRYPKFQKYHKLLSDELTPLSSKPISNEAVLALLKTNDGQTLVRRKGAFLSRFRLRAPKHYFPKTFVWGSSTNMKITRDNLDRLYVIARRGAVHNLLLLLNLVIDVYEFAHQQRELVLGARTLQQVFVRVIRPFVLSVVSKERNKLVSAKINMKDRSTRTVVELVAFLIITSDTQGERQKRRYDIATQRNSVLRYLNLHGLSRRRRLNATNYDFGSYMPVSTVTQPNPNVVSSRA